MLNPHHILTFSTGIKKLTQTICIFVILSINSRFSTFVTTTSEFPAKNMKMPDFYSPSAMPEPPHYRNPTQYVAEKYFSFLPVLPSKTDIRNPLSLLAHERSRFANCQWELLTPTDISIPLTHRLVHYTLEAGDCLFCVQTPS